tara:strand:- start:669 stop:953 length:285 start_codon:yes stop_codon:yes gene_type:complete
MPRVKLEGHIIVSESDLAAVMEELKNHITNTRAEKGCITFKVSQDPNNKCRFNVYEEFDSAESFQYHQRKVQASVWGSIAANVERNYTIEGLEA